MAKIDRIARLLALANGGSGSGTNISMEIVDTLPEVGESGVIYLVKKTGKKKDIYDEYMYVNNDWELIGNTSKTIILDPIVMLGANQGDMGRETVLAFLQQINVDEHKLYNDLINSTIDNAKVEGQMFNLITPTPQGQVPLTFPISSQILVKMDLSFLANDPDWQPHVFENANLILSFIIMGFDKQIPLLISIFQLDTVNKQIVGFGWKEIK